MTLRALRRELRTLQARLALAEWRIELHRGTPVEHDAPDLWRRHEMYAGCAGVTDWHTEERIAIILLRRGEGRDTLLHELLHIRLEGHTMRARRYDPQYEYAINALAVALA